MEKEPIEQDWTERLKEMPLTDFLTYVDEIYSGEAQIYEAFKPILERELVRRGLRGEPIYD